MYILNICHIPIQWKNYGLGNSYSQFKSPFIFLLKSMMAPPGQVLFLKIKESCLADTCWAWGEKAWPSDGRGFREAPSSSPVHPPLHPDSNSYLAHSPRRAMRLFIAFSVSSFCFEIIWLLDEMKAPRATEVQWIVVIFLAARHLNPFLCRCNFPLLWVESVLPKDMFKS